MTISHVVSSVLLKIFSYCICPIFDYMTISHIVSSVLLKNIILLYLSLK